MTGALLASCILFMAGQGAISTHQLVLYWITKLIAIFLEPVINFDTPERN
jgi:hypothetical protein